MLLCMFQKGMRCAHQITLFGDTGTHGLQGFLVTDRQFLQGLVAVDVTSVTGETCVVLVQVRSLSDCGNACCVVCEREKTRSKAECGAHVKLGHFGERW